MSDNPVDPQKIIESLLRQVAAQAQQIAMLQAIVEQAIVSAEPDEVIANAE